MTSNEASLPNVQLLQRQGDLPAAEQMCHDLLEKNPNDAAVYLALSQLQAQQGRRDDAMRTLRTAGGRFPNQPGFPAQLGNLLAEAGFYTDAIEAHREALRLAPANAALHYNLANSLKARGEWGAAAASFHNAIRLNPKMAPAYINLGNVLFTLGQLDRAVEAYLAGLELLPEDAIAHNNLGNAYRALGLFDKAEASYRQTLRLTHETSAEAWNNLSDICLLGGRHEEALAYVQTAMKLSPDNPAIHSHFISVLQYLPDGSAAQIRHAIDAWRIKFADPLEPEIPTHGNNRDPERPIRIGYLISEADRVAACNLVSLFRNHDRSHFEIFAYSEATGPNPIMDFFRSNAKFVNIAGRTLREIAATFRRDRIDILVDLTAHQAGSRLQVFALKPAPIQVTFTGYLGTTGLRAMDYRVTDSLLDPLPEKDSANAEASIRLETFCCYDLIEAPPAPNALPALSAGHVTFGCLNEFSTLNSRTLVLWAKVLQQVPGSQLMLMAEEGLHRAKVRGMLLPFGIAPEQIIYVPNGPRHIEYYHQMDLMLDTLPVNGNTTTLDSLFMGVPVVSLIGTTTMGRTGLSLLTNLGMPQWAAESEDAFVKTAAGLAGDLPALAGLRAQLRQKMMTSVLTDGKRFTQGVESSYRDIWRKWCGR